MRTLAALPEFKQERTARETLDIYAPLANRLGMQDVKVQLEDLSLATLHPKRYSEIAQMVQDRAPERDMYLTQLVANVKERFSDMGIKADVSGRPKHLWSIYEKMIVKGRPFEEIYDLVGIRVIVENVRDCYAALGTIHATWKPVQGRFKDYIAMPKFNLYQSLHTTVIGPQGKPLEVQIRTRDMHHRAEHGAAAHFSYKEKVDENFAAAMITNPNTCGLFEDDIIEIANYIHDAGGYLYCDGANFNALVGKVRPGDLGIDAMHINLHKTFSTPHGGGGPGSGPVVFSSILKDFCPAPLLKEVDEKYYLVENNDDEEIDESFGRLCVFHGQMGMFVRALSYMMSHGSDGLRQVSEDAVLNANYIKSSLEDILTPAYDGYCMHEVLFNDDFLSGTGVETIDFAKALIDKGYHPMTIYFPLVVHGALLVEPTETESKNSLDQFIGTIRELAIKIHEGDEFFKKAPIYTPIRRLDETKAARNPVLRWQKNEVIAAE